MLINLKTTIFPLYPELQSKSTRYGEDGFFWGRGQLLDHKNKTQITNKNNQILFCLQEINKIFKLACVQIEKIDEIKI